MSNFLQTRGMLAKLLTTENLVVEHDSSAHLLLHSTQTLVCSNCLFSRLRTRTFTICSWAHECAHALETPQHWKDDIPKGVSFDFVNVIEDEHIEKFIQDKFPGLRVDFTRDMMN